MKNVFLLSIRCRLAVPGGLLGLVLVAGAVAHAQNFVRNPDFRWPMGPDNWTVVYPNNSSESDWYIHGRSTISHRDKVYGTWDGNYFGAHFRPYTDGLMEAYFTQVVTNLTPGASYQVSCWSSHFNSNFIPPNPEKIRAWIESVGGNGTVASGFVTGYCYQNNGWLKYNADNTADANGNIEVRLRAKKIAFTANQKWLDIDVFFDHVAVMPAVAPTLPSPVLSLAVTNQQATFRWSTIRNNSYDLKVSTDLASWSRFQGGFVATGTNLTFTTNLVADPSIPQFFRVVSYDYAP